MRRSATLLERAPDPTTEYGELLQWSMADAEANTRAEPAQGGQSTLAAGTLRHGPVPGI